MLTGSRIHGACLPPKRVDHTWVVQFCESPAIFRKLLDSEFMRQFDLKISHELDSDVVLTALHPLVDGSTVPPKPMAEATIASGRGDTAAHCPRVDCILLPGTQPARWTCSPAAVRPTPIGAVAVYWQVHAQPRRAVITECAKQVDGVARGLCKHVWTSEIIALSRHAFCLVAENSIARDYFTEKLSHAPVRGWLPAGVGSIPYQFLPRHDRC
jgi:hypothetical protein